LRRIWSWILSVSLHLLLVAFLLFWNWIRRAPVPQEAQTVEVAILEQAPTISRPPSKPPVPVSAKLAAGKKVRKRTKPLTLSDLLPPTVPSLQTNSAKSGESSQTSGNFLTEAFAKNQDQAPIFRCIFDRLNENFIFPTEFADAGIDGTAKTTLVFSSNGELIKSRSDVNTLSNYVKVDVWRALRQAFVQPLPHKLLTTPGELVIHAEFILQITSEGRNSPTGPSRQLLAGTHMIFYRSRFSSKMAWSLGPFHGLGIVPAVAIDPGWFVDAFTKLFTKKAVVDPLQNYRDDPDWTR
jgi:hypothetical protein